MYTDWILVRRLAYELAERHNGARVRDAGQLEDGRFALALWKAGRTQVLSADMFAPTPLMTIEDAELPIAVEPGFARAVGAALRGKTLSAAHAVDGERILRLDFAAQSRFGVSNLYALVFELVPRFGNIVLIKGGMIVAALKEFTPSAHAARAIRAGKPYQAPPPRPGPARALIEPPPQLDEILRDDLYVYRQDDGTLVQAHLLPLVQYQGLRCERSASLLGLFGESLRAVRAEGWLETSRKERDKAERALSARERKLRAELERIDERLADAGIRNQLRERGEQIYAKLHELSPAEQTAAKGEAGSLFSRYKKAAAAADHLARRRAGVMQSLDEIGEFQWELHRAGPRELPEILDLIASLGRRKKSAPAKNRQKRKPFERLLPQGSRVLIGRSPAENAELTFHVARPGDLWFHVRGQPGAHVVLQRPDRRAPPPEDILAAAQLAAFHSKAKTSSKVTVDYTQRKHVRKLRNSAPGLVTYTNASSLLVQPRDLR